MYHSDEIVQKLRDAAPVGQLPDDVVKLLLDAASEIELLSSVNEGLNEQIHGGCHGQGA